MQQLTLFPDNSQRDPEYWAGMPAYTQANLMPAAKISVQFRTKSEFLAFCNRNGLRPVSSDWYGTADWAPSSRGLMYTQSTACRVPRLKYPICIPSKGRSECQWTSGMLQRCKIKDYFFFVEMHEADLYRKHVGEKHVVELPFSNLGMGSIPARNYIMQWARERGHAKHWVLDDNIRNMYRLHGNRRVIVESRGIFLAMEHFSDRYENVLICGPSHDGFANQKQSLMPVKWNTRVYSCMLLATGAYEWRGRYNEDTDLCLRVLKDGHCTALFRALLMKKGPTKFSKNRAMKGGNSDNIYADMNFRSDFVDSLIEQHPECVRKKWKWNRWHHVVDYSRFVGNAPRYVSTYVAPVGSNDFGMILDERE